MKRRILLLTNPPWLKTGLAQAGTSLMKYLYSRSDKYELAWYCSQVSEADPQLRMTPWKSYGALPSDPQSIQQLNQDPGKARDASYGAWNIDKVIKDFKPDVFIGSDDAWGFNKGNFLDKPWWNKINSILHITLDSYPILEQAFEQAEHTKTYLTWAKFAQNDMKRRNPKCQHVGQIYGAMDTDQFTPISANEKAELRKRFGIGPNTVIFNYVFRNQLRKSANLILEGFAQFKRENPTADVKLHFHTSVSERAMGWDLPKMMAFYGIPNTDVLFTYVCKQCGQWHVSPYLGEDINCPYCKAEKSMITVNIVHGVPANEMKYIYGIADAAFSVHTSGGQELTSCQSMLCGLPLACTNYSCGEDFCANPDVFSLSWHPYHEAGTNFIKAATDIGDIKKFMTRIWRMNPKDVKALGERSRAWAKKTFSIETIGAQWETLIDSLPVVDWSTVDLTPQIKNDQYPFPQIEDPDKFLTALYTEILKMDERPDGDGRKHWLARMKEGMKREEIYNYFLSVAKTENAKQGAPQQDFWSMIDKTTGRKRAIFVVRESLGDCLMCTQLFESFHREYPNHDLYVATKPGMFPIFEGNPHVFKLLPHTDVMELEMAMCGAGQKEAYFDVFLYPAIATQRWLAYLNHESAAFKQHLYLT